MGMSLWVDHFGIALRSLDEGEDFFARYLPLQAIGGETPGASGDARSRFYQLGHVRLALFESARPDSFVETFLQKRGEGLHHLSFRCSEFDALEASLRASGLSLVEGPVLAEQGRTLVVTPKDLFGMYFVIVETSDSPPPVLPPRDRIVALPGGGAMLFDHMAAAVPDLDAARQVLMENFPVTGDGGRHRGYAGDFDLSQFELAGFRFELVADASLVFDPEHLSQGVVRRVKLLRYSRRGLNPLKPIGVANVLHGVDDCIEELLLKIFKLPRGKGVAGEITK